MFFKLKQVFYTIFKYLIPQKDIFFFSDYLQILNSTANVSSNSNNLTIACFRLLLISFLFKSFHFLYIIFGSLSEWGRMINYDVINILCNKYFISKKLFKFLCLFYLAYACRYDLYIFCISGYFK